MLVLLPLLRCFAGSGLSRIITSVYVNAQSAWDAREACRTGLHREQKCAAEKHAQTRRLERRLIYGSSCGTYYAPNGGHSLPCSVINVWS